MSKEFEKKYSVYIEEDPKVVGEYMYCKVDDAPSNGKGKKFTMTYFFKKIGKDRNPMMVIDKIEGDDFKHRHDIILDFEQNCALSFSVELDGLLKILDPKSENGDLDFDEDREGWDA